MRYLISCLIILFSAPQSAQAEMALFGAGDSISVKEVPGVNSGTMAGNQSFMTRTDRLFAAFQLRNSAESERTTNVREELKYAQFWLPSIPNINEYKLCSEIRTVNETYLGYVERDLKDIAEDGSLTLEPKPYGKDENQKARITIEHPENNLLPRTLIAKDCNALRSSYYVPASWSVKEPDELLVIIEIVAAVIIVEVFPINTKTDQVDEGVKGVPLDCVPSKKVPGFDCVKQLSTLPATALELRLTARFTEDAESETTFARLTVPKK